jgi:tetratricopeptide (TPR) repeat protein
MSLDCESRLDELFHGALALPPQRRDVFLSRECAQDPRMFALVKNLLRHHDDPGPADLDRPALAHLAEQMRDDSPEDVADLLDASDATPPGDGAEGDSAAESAAALPRRFGDYELLRELGHGGMGVVYLARQLSANRPVAVKILLARVLEDLPPDRREQAVRRFRAEAEAMAGLMHEHIVTVHEVGACDGRHYYSMRYVEGRSLAEVVRKHPLDGRVAAPLVEQAARAVHYAHGQGVLHRDLTPGNILLDRDNRPFVADFGLVKLLASDSDLTRTGEFLGTPGYVAPEQADDPSRASAASDIYSLGATLYHLLTGRPPFQAATVAETLRQVCADEPVPPRTVNPSVPRDLETICLKCLEKEPRRRYACCEQLADDLGRWQRGEPIRARPVRWPERCWRWCRRRPALAGLTAALVLVVLVALGMIVASEARAREGERTAQEQMRRAQAAQRDAENNHVKTLELIDQVLIVTAVTRLGEGSGQGLAIEMLRAVESRCQSLLRERPEDVKLLMLQGRNCMEQAEQHFIGKQHALRVQAARRAARAYQGAVRLLETNQGDQVRLIREMLALGRAQHGAGETAAAVASFRRAATLKARLAQALPPDAKQRHEHAEWCLQVGHCLRMTGAPADALGQLELARQLLEGLVREEPGDLRFLVRLGDAWYQLGQTRRIMGRHDEALAAYRQSVQRLRTAFKHAPDEPEYRKKLSLQYGRLAYWLRQRGCLGEAAANLLEQKKLWPGDAEKLSDIAENLSYLAVLVGDGRTELTPAEWSELQRYLDQSEQVQREATAAQSRTKRAKS